MVIALNAHRQPTWRRRGYLPHLDYPGAAQHVIFRLADSLPASALAEKDRTATMGKHGQADEILDRGLGRRLLADPSCAGIVAGALAWFDQQRYSLLAWCVMPNHVHVLAQEADCWPLGGVVHAWKSFTANRINAHLGLSGRLWAADYFDRAARSDRELEAVTIYIEENPVAAGLCDNAQAWPWSSATARKP